MRRLLPCLVLAVLASGCAASSTGTSAAPAAPKKDKNGCATAQSAFGSYYDLKQGARESSLTPDDMTKLLGKIHDKMDAVSTIAAPELAGHAKQAAVAAGHMRVALAGQGDFDVKVENSTMGRELDAAAAYCA